MSVPSAELVADAIAVALTDDSGLGIAPTRTRFPKYAMSDLVNIKIDVIPEYPVSVDAHDRASTATDIPIVVLVQQKCEKTDTVRVDQLSKLLEDISQWLALSPIVGIGQPIEPVIIDRNDALLDQGQFIGASLLVYRTYRELQ